MSTTWIRHCDRCGKEERAGDKRAQDLLGMPEQPNDAYFRLSRRGGNGAELRLDLCGECGEWMEANLRAFVPQRFWDATAAEEAE